MSAQRGRTPTGRVGGAGGVADRGVGAVAHPSKRDGMGAGVHDGGVTFRVWAPFADGVAVAGDFNDWSGDQHPLAAEEGGRWSRDVEGVPPGAAYKFVVTRGDRRLWRIDPYARDVSSSVGHGIVTADTYTWGDDGWHMPSWDELVIYELHAGTFNDRPGGGPGGFASVVRRLDYLKALGVNAIELMPTMEFAVATRGVTTPRTSSRSRRPTAVQATSSGWSTRRISGASRCCSTSSTTTSGRVTSTCGSSMGGARTARAASTSTTTDDLPRRGATPGPTTGARRCARSSPTTPGGGSTSSTSTACAGT